VFDLSQFQPLLGMSSYQERHSLTPEATQHLKNQLGSPNTTLTSLGCGSASSFIATSSAHLRALLQRRSILKSLTRSTPLVLEAQMQHVPREHETDHAEACQSDQGVSDAAPEPARGFLPGTGRVV